MSKENAMQTISSHIKNNTYGKVYLMYGSEPYLLNQYRDNLKNALGCEDGSMNYSVYKTPNPDIRSIISDCETMPFFAERRVVLVENSGLFKAANDDLTDYIPNIPESTVLIFCETEVDKRLKLFKAVAANGYELAFDTPDDMTLAKWLKARFSSDGIKADDRAIFALINAIGQDMTALATEAKKLSDYCFERKFITVDDVDILCNKKVEDKIFELMDAISRHDKRNAIRMYNDLLLLRDDAMHILALITRHYNLLSQIKLMQQSNTSAQTMASVTKLREFAVKKYMQQTKSYEYKTLLHCYDLCQNTDAMIKSGQAGDRASSRQQAVELLILELINT